MFGKLRTEISGTSHDAHSGSRAGRSTTDHLVFRRRVEADDLWVEVTVLCCVWSDCVCRTCIYLCIYLCIHLFIHLLIVFQNPYTVVGAMNIGTVK